MTDIDISREAVERLAKFCTHVPQDVSATLRALRAALDATPLPPPADKAQPEPDVIGAALFDPEGHWNDFILSAVSEAEKAMRKFPQPNYVISKVAEEAGEVVKAAKHG